MTSYTSLFALSSELIGAIADLLPSQAITNLLNTGNGALRYRIRKGAANLELEVGPLENFPSWAFSFPRLRSLRVLSVHRKYSSPVSPLTLDLLPHEPHTLLHTLEFCFLPAMLVLRPHSDDRTIANMCPNLTKLKVAIGRQFQSSWLRNLPSTISILHLDFQDQDDSRPTYFRPGDIASLPESLTELEMSQNGLFRVTPKPDTIWPQNLTKLVCETYNPLPFFDSLPRTLMHLSCSETCHSDPIPFSLLPPGLVFFEFKKRMPTFILDAPLPPRMRVFLVDQISKYRTVDGQYLATGHMDATELDEKFPFFFPPTLEHFTTPSVATKVLLKHCPAIQEIGPSNSFFRFFPNWSYKNASLVLRQLNDPENPKWLQRHLARSKKALLSGKELKEEEEPEAVKSYRFMNLKTITIDNRLDLTQGNAHFMWSGLINPKVLQSYQGPLVREYAKLIVSAGVALRRLVIPFSWSPEPLTCQFVEYLGKSLIELNCATTVLPNLSSPEFVKRQLFWSFNSNFETLELRLDPVWHENFWSTLPIPPSSTSVTIFMYTQKFLHEQYKAINADWSSLTQLKTLRIETAQLKELSTVEPTTHLQIPGFRHPTRFETPGVTYSGIATLPPSITDLRCFLPVQLSVEGVAALPRNLISAHFAFCNGDANSWTPKHWEAFPKKIISLTLLGWIGAKAIHSRLLHAPDTTVTSRAANLRKRYEGIAFWH